MTQSSDKIAALIGSRICHDLISPVGAVANGLELLELAGTPRGPELTLVAESAGHASARIRFFRLVFGDASAGESVPGESIAELLRVIHGHGRITVDWQAEGHYPRHKIKAVLMALLCVEQALSGGGRISLRETGGNWRIHASGAGGSRDPALWDMLRGAPAPARISPAAVQFLLLPSAAAAAGFRIDLSTSSPDQLQIALLG